jgi:Mg-chelatase subunit ChlD
MKRILYDVPRWSIYLHRQARRLEPGDIGDSGRRRLEDELFERLYAGELVPLPARKQDAPLRAWAEGVHTACAELPAFTRLADECRGDADAATLALEELLRELEPKLSEAPDAQRLRPLLRGACERASAAIDELRDGVGGLQQVAFGRQAGTGSVIGAPQSSPASIGLARRLRDDERLRRIALLAGRFKRIGARKRRERVRHGADEIVDVELGADLGRLLPAELARLTHPRLRLAMHRDLAERRCLQYRLDGVESLGKGPLVVCLDKSGSMDGDPDIWATAVALALLHVAHYERRPFALLGFDERVKHEAIVRHGESLPESALFVACGGGTNIGNVLQRGLDIVEQHPGALRRADIVLITDGESPIDAAAELRHRASQLGVTILGFGIGIAPAALSAWCDDAHAVERLDGLDDATAGQLFAR